jgi:uncharacterized protein
MSPQSRLEPFEDVAVDPPVRGFLHIPEPATGDGLVLTHGAGGNAQAPLLRALADLFAQAGFHVLRCNLPYRQRRSFGPPRPADAAGDRAGLANALCTLKKLSPRHIFLGGHSYGGRQSTMLVAENPGVVEGLLLMSYPLHPPGQPERLRVQHFPSLQTRALFVHGTRDPFGAPEELSANLKLIPAETRLLTVEGAGHDLGFKGKGTQANLPERIWQAFQEFFS